MKPPVRFDDSLPAFAELVKDAWGEIALSNNLFLRDASGRLTFIILQDSHSAEERATLASSAATQLGKYVDDAGFSVATPEELFDDSLHDISGALKLHLDDPRFKGDVYLIDRRMVGADWLRPPEPAAAAPARFVFASLKGGVGRSTALCVLAAHLSAHGRRVIAIDMDLEAPGLGNMLLSPDTLPEFGLLDYFVESEAGGDIDEQFFADMVGPSWLADGRGRVDVIPAIGKRSLLNPANVLAKLARAYLGGSPLSKSLSFSDHMRLLVERFADPLRYDAILVDARAGLHETTAAAITGLGAEVLFFGLDEPQTFAGYELLFAHLATLSESPVNEWRSHLHVIQSKAPNDSRRREKFSQKMGSLVHKYSPREIPTDVDLDWSSLKDTFEVEWSKDHSMAVDSLLDAEPPSSVLAILDSDQFRSFDPVANRDLLSEPSYLLPFSQLLEMALTVIASFTEREPGGKQE